MAKEMERWVPRERWSEQKAVRLPLGELITGSVSFGERTLTSLSGSQDIFVWKLNADASTAGSTSLGTKNRDDSNGIAVDGARNVYLTGAWNEIARLPLQSAPGAATARIVDGNLGCKCRIASAFG